MSPRVRRLSWFGGLYLAAVGTLVPVTAAMHAVLRLVTGSSPVNTDSPLP